MPENLPPVIFGFLRLKPDAITLLRIAMAGVYRIGIVAGTLVLIGKGATPWLLLAVFPFMFVGPRSR